jgi:hypothetical protein
MGHSSELLNRIAEDVARAWPKGKGYRMEFEKPLAGQPGLRMLPDIQVLDPSKTVCCVVEIGYTRPEKLTKYHELGIQDVRWYDKLGNIHGNIDKALKVIEQHIRYVPLSNHEFNWFSQFGIFECDDCLATALEELDQLCGCEQDDCSCAPRVPPSDEAIELASENHSESILTLISDGHRYLAVVYCDECEATRLLEDHKWDLLGLENARDFEFRYLQRTKEDRLHAQGPFTAWLEEILHPGPLTAWLYTYRRWSYSDTVEALSEALARPITYDDFRRWESR